MKNKLLLTTAVYPFPSLPQNEAATDVMGQRFTRGNDIFTMVSHTHPCAIHLLAQNLQIPSVVLEYPRWNQFCREIQRGYSFIGISAYPFHLDIVLKMCRYVRENSPETKILVGSYAAQTLKALGGLEKYGDLIDDLVDEEGVSYFRRLFSEDAQRPKNQFFFPKNGAGMRYLSKNPRGNTVFLFSGLGCPGGCDFCSSSAQYKRKRIELLSPKAVVEHVQHYLKHDSGLIDQFYLIDEDHFRWPKYLLELKKLISENPEIPEKVDFVAFGSVDYIARFAKEHGWEAIAETGIGVIFIGVESQSAGGHGYNKRQSANAKEVFYQLHKIGIRTIGAWIAGFSFQNRETLMADLKYFISCYPTYQQLSIFSPFPGTPLHDSLQKRKLAPQCQFSDYHFWNPKSSHPEFTNQELFKFTEDGYTLGYETWGPCLLRNLDVHLNGIQFCRQAQSPILRAHTQSHHKKNAGKIYTQLKAMMKFAPNTEVRERIRLIEKRYRAFLGEPGVLMRLLSQVSLALAIFFKFKSTFRIFKWTPKIEGFRRYIYDPAKATRDQRPYAIDRWASFNFRFSLRKLFSLHILKPLRTQWLRVRAQEANQPRIFSSIPSNTPLTSAPDDYFPAGQAKWYSLPGGKDRDRKIFFTDQSFGQGGSTQALVFVHGNPECSYVFRKVICWLLKKKLPSTRIITVDHIGFGLSDQATRPMDPLDHAVNLTQLIEHLNLSKATLVVHDWGGPIGFGAFLNKPDLLKKVVILNSSVFPLPKNGFNYSNHPFPFLSWVLMRGLVPDRYWGFFASKVVTSKAFNRSSLIRNILGYPFKKPISSKKNDPYRLQFTSKTNVKSSKNLARLAKNWCEIMDAQDPVLNDFYRKLQKKIPFFWGPAGANIQARLLFGQWDPLGSEACSKLWLQALPQMENRMVIYKDTGHFLPENRPQEIAEAIFELLTEPETQENSFSSSSLAGNESAQFFF